MTRWYLAGVLVLLQQLSFGECYKSEYSYIDSWGICVPDHVNSCWPKILAFDEIDHKNGLDRTNGRCRLNESISENMPVPGWVTKQHQDLMEKTITEFHNKTPRSTYSIVPDQARSMGRVCKYSKSGALGWDTAELVLFEQQDCIPGYLSFGFHPFGKEPGYWLTQIMAMSTPTDKWLNYRTDRSLVGGFFVNITKINDDYPVDGRFETLRPPTQLKDLQGESTYRHGNSSFRTDQDLVLRGFDYECCNKYRQIGDNKPPRYYRCDNTSYAHQRCIPGITAAVNVTWTRYLLYPYDVPPCLGVTQPSSASSRSIAFPSIFMLLSVVGAVSML